ncbi:MAG TPA: hypothetical protein VFM64_03950 [Candidatus Nitrosotenuis sp.]|nr:hypothetical protein [Candidatus Nitrosotenuis sp.]
MPKSFVGAHNNVHIPNESWPYWTWFAIEFFIVMAVSALISNQIVIHLMSETSQSMQNWLFFGMIGAFVLGWYMGIRSLVFKKKVLETRY